MVSSLQIYYSWTFSENGMTVKNFDFEMLFRHFFSMCDKVASCASPQLLFLGTYDELGQHQICF